MYHKNKFITFYFNFILIFSLVASFTKELLVLLDLSYQAYFPIIKYLTTNNYLQLKKHII